jgi:ornithine carbamoyltransferase
MKRDFLELRSHSRAELEEILALSARLKAELKQGIQLKHLAGKSLAMIFEKPSLRTRVTFEIGIVQLGGFPVYLTPNDIQLNQRESVADIARNLSRWVDLIMARTFSHDTLLELAANADVPVINGLSDLYHPCQVMADLLTLLEHRGRLDGQRIAFIGDANNMANSWINAALKFDFEFVLACPEGYAPQREIFETARAQGARVEVTHDVAAAAKDADALYTDVWTSMGQEAESEQRKRDFRDFQINAALVARAKPDAIVMHCLPAHRGEEITSDVIDGPQAVVFDQAENRLHAQKGIMLWLAGQKD